MQSKIGTKRAKAILWRVASRKGKVLGRCLVGGVLFTNSFPTLE
jgi:type IV secretory pathway TrbF-like protein